MIKAIFAAIRRAFSVNYETNTKAIRNIAIERESNTRIIFRFPKCILGEDVILREENNFKMMEYEKNKQYTFNLFNVLYVDAIGIGYLTEQQKTIRSLGSEMEITNANDKVLEVFNLLGLDKCFFSEKSS